MMVPLFLLGVNLFLSCQQGWLYLKAQDIDDEIHWKFYRQMITDIIDNAGGTEFGYFIYSPDQFGYQSKYALRYFADQKSYPATPFVKKTLTYLLFAPNISNNPWADEWYWQEQKVKINREADKQWTYSHDDTMSYTIKRYDLNANEATIAADPYLIDGIQFR
ncbi:hypothetical protein IJJ08_00810 [bacterium]|nr:hypothetical protein [bacterium]